MSTARILRAASAAIIIAALAFAAMAQQDDSGSTDEVSLVGKPVRVVMNDGQRLSGVIVEERADAVVIRIGKVETTLARSHIDRITVERPAIERYREMRAILDPEDTDRMLMLIDWMRTEGLLEEAKREITAVLEREPGNGDALRLSKLIDEQLTLRAGMRNRDDEESPPRRTITPRELRRPSAQEFPLLSEEEANLVKVYEVDLDDPPRLLIERDTIDALISGHRGEAGIPRQEGEDQAFRRRPAHEILRAMFEVRARDLYGEVRVIDLPESLRLFRDNVNATWLVNGCATTACHGGYQAGDFMLYNRTPTREEAALTNLLILERYRTEEGVPLIDYARPERSLLLQLTMKPNISAWPHPRVPGYKPIFMSTRSRRYVQAVEWIEAMHRPRPDYPVDFTPPTPADFLGSDPSSPAGEEPPDR